MGDGQTNQTSCQNGTQILQFLFVSPMWWILLSVPWYRIHGCVLDHCLDVIAQKGVLTRPPKTPKLENQDLPIFYIFFYGGTLGTRGFSCFWCIEGRLDFPKVILLFSRSGPSGMGRSSANDCLQRAKFTVPVNRTWLHTNLQRYKFLRNSF